MKPTVATPLRRHQPIAACASGTPQPFTATALGLSSFSARVNPDRISPEQTAQFSFVMLVCTPAGDAYTKDVLGGMAAEAGFARSELHPLDDTTQQALISYR